MVQRKTAFSIASMKDQVKSICDLRVSRDTAEELSDELEDYAEEITRKAVRYAEENNRTTVRAEDIRKAVSEN